MAPPGTASCPDSYRNGTEYVDRLRSLNDATIPVLVRCPPVDPLVSAWRVERRGEFSPLGPRAGCFLALGFGLRLVGTASASR